MSTTLLDAIRQALKQAVRTLLKSPGFALIAIASLAIGIAGNTAIFIIADALLLRPRPGINNPHRLVDIGGTRPGHGLDTMSYPNLVDLRRDGAQPSALGAPLQSRRPCHRSGGQQRSGAASGIREPG